jgi:hypothetical protein
MSGLRVVDLKTLDLGFEPAKRFKDVSNMLGRFDHVSHLRPWEEETAHWHRENC